VAGDSPEDLKKGLEKAEELLPKMGMMEGEEESEESEEDMMAEMEELERKLLEIKAKLNK
jgi:hypothetical protein